jgi:hypothetical protein
MLQNGIMEVNDKDTAEVQRSTKVSATKVPAKNTPMSAGPHLQPMSFATYLQLNFSHLTLNSFFKIPPLNLI